MRKIKGSFGIRGGKKMNINIEYKHETGLKIFLAALRAKNFPFCTTSIRDPMRKSGFCKYKSMQTKPFAWDIPTRHCFLPKINANRHTNFRNLAITYWLWAAERSTIWQNPFPRVWGGRMRGACNGGKNGRILFQRRGVDARRI